MTGRRRAITIYQIRRSIDGVLVTDFDQTIDPDVLAELETYDLAEDFGFDARLYIDTPEQVPARVRRVDVKPVAENTLRTQRQKLSTRSWPSGVGGRSWKHSHSSRRST